MATEKITKEKIITSVLKIAFINSIEGTSLSDIAADVGIKKASLYSHFESREKLLSAANKFCAAILRANPYIPHDYEDTIAKYSVPVVLKGIVRRYIKVYERDLPLRAMFYLETGKFCNAEAGEIIREEREKIRSQMRTLFAACAKARKFPYSTADEIKTAAWWFTSAVCDYTRDYLLELKYALTENTDGVQAVSAKRLPEIDSYIDRLCRLWKLDAE
jgi:AcrR family transcriptional regulator